MITLFGHPGSTCTRKVLTVLAETATPYEFSLVDLAKGEHKQPAHLARQPFGQIPAIDHDGFMLFEARAICRYLSGKAGHPLTPNNDQERALMDQWLSVEQSNFSPNAMKFVYHYVMKRPQEDAVLEAAKKLLVTTYEALSGSLAKNTFVSGEQFTLADIGYMPYIEYMEMGPAKEIMAKYPNVVAWWKRVSARPSWLKATGKG
jgi:glutathione S-transferase